MFKSEQGGGRDEQAEGSVARGSDSRFFCAFLVRKRGCVSARGGCIELQIARGQMDVHGRTRSLRQQKNVQGPWKSSDLLPISYPRNLDSTADSHPWVLGYLDALSEERRKKWGINKYRRTERLDRVSTSQTATEFRLPDLAIFVKREELKALIPRDVGSSGWRIGGDRIFWRKKSRVSYQPARR